MRRTFLLVLAVIALQVGAAPAHAEDTLCEIEFDAKRFGFEVQAVHPDEEQSCGRFLTSKLPTDEFDPVVTSIAVLPGSATEALKTNPSNFVVTKGGTLKFRRPKRVDDYKSFYFVRPLRVLSERRASTPGGDVYFVEYKRRVVRLKRTGDREEAEVEELQHCFDAVKTTSAKTVLLSGCKPAVNGPEVARRAFDLLASAKLPAVR